MGCFHATCGLTDVAIPHGTDCRLMIMSAVPSKDRCEKNDVFYAYDLYQPKTFLVKGKYNDYGGLEDVTPAERKKFYDSAAMSETKISYEPGDKEDEDVIGGGMKLAPGHYMWFIREDSFEMLSKLPIECWGKFQAKTVGGMIKQRKAAIRKIVERSLSNRDQYDMIPWSLRDEYNDAYDRSEMPMWKLRHGLIQLDEARKDVKAFLRESDDFMDLIKLYHGLNVLRKALYPAAGAGSQSFDTRAYRMLSRKIDAQCKAWDDYCR